MTIPAVWAGVIGAVAGGALGVGGSILQGVITRREGRDARQHDYDRRFWELRAMAYVEVLDYVGRISGWTQKIQGLIERTEFNDLAEVEVLTTEDEWYTVLGQLRAFGSDEALSLFTTTHKQGGVVATAIKREDPSKKILAACSEFAGTAAALHKQLLAELRPSSPGI